MPHHELTFDSSATPLDAIQRAIYRLSDRLSCDLSIADGRCHCTVHTCDDSAISMDEVVAQLRNEVLDETLRQRVREETREVRNLILALAFSNTGLIDDASAQ